MCIHAQVVARYFLLITLCLFFGCGKEESTRVTGPPGGGRTQLNPVSNLRAYSASDTSVGLAWILSTSEDNPDFNNYYIRAKTQEGILVSTTTAAQGDTGIVVDSLTEGVVYIFEVTATAVYNSSTYMNSASRIIRWAPARRLNAVKSGQPINVYESSDSMGIHSGLVFFDATSLVPKVVSTSNPGADSLSVDIYVRTESNHGVSMRSASLLHPTWRLTRFANSPPRKSDSLDDPRYVSPDSALFTVKTIVIDSSATPTAVIYFFKGARGNYGRILLQRNPDNGTLIWGRSPAQYLNVKISYQTVPYNRFSKGQ